MIRGSFYGTDTLFTDIRKLPQASSLSVKPNGYHLDRYWQLAFHTPGDPSQSKDTILEEANDLLCQSSRRLLTTLKAPVMFLSGGVDSRLMLGYLQTEGENYIPSVTWGTATVDASSDLEVGSRIAEACGLPHESFRIDSEELLCVAVQAVLGVDGRGEVLDSPSLTRLWPELANRYKSFFNGDEWFGWRGRAIDEEDALFKIGWWDLTQVERIADWIRPECQESIHIALIEGLQALVQSADESDPTNLKDKLYYQERIGNLLNGALGGKLAWLQPGQLFLDEDLIDFLARIPQEFRIDKSITGLLLQRYYPKLDKLGYAKFKSLPTGVALASMLQTTEAMVEFFESHLFDYPSPVLEEIFNLNRVKEVFNALVRGASMPQMRGRLLSRLPLIGRFTIAPINRVHPAIGILRLLALNLYLINQNRNICDSST